MTGLLNGGTGLREFPLNVGMCVLGGNLRLDAMNDDTSIAHDEAEKLCELKPAQILSGGWLGFRVTSGLAILGCGLFGSRPNRVVCLCNATVRRVSRR